MASSEISKNFKLLNDLPLDAWYGPYDSIAEAVANIPQEIRLGKRFGVNTPDGIVDCWWNKLTTDEGVVRYNQISTTQLDYMGNYDPSTNTPPLSNENGEKGQWYIASVAGSFDFGSGIVNMVVGDNILHNGIKFEVVSSNQKADKSYVDYIFNTVNEDITQIGIDLDSETNRAISSEVIIQSNIEAETARALLAEEILQVNISSEANRAVSAESALTSLISAKANTSDILSNVEISLADLTTTTTYTNILFANRTNVPIQYKNPTTPVIGFLNFNSSGVATLPVTAVSGFVAILFGTTGVLSKFIEKLEVSANKKYPFDDISTAPSQTLWGQGILDVEINLGDETKQYYISYVGNYFFANPLYRNYFQISEVGGSIVAGGKNAAGVWTVTAIQTGIELIPLYGALNTIIGYALVNWDKIYPAGGRTTVTSTLGLLSRRINFNRSYLNVKNPPIVPLYDKGVFASTATINTTNQDIYRAIEKIELYGANPLKRYYLKTFARNRTLNGAYYIIIEEEGHSFITGVCYYNTTLTENTSGVNVVYLTTSDGSGITGKVWIDWTRIIATSYPTLLNLTLQQGQLSSTVHVSSDGTGSFSEENDRLIVGDNLYLVNEDNLQLCKNSMISSEYYAGQLGLQTGSDDAPFADWFIRNLTINQSKFTNLKTARIFNKIDGKTTLYYKDVNIKKVSTSTLSGKACELFMFGDSITDGVSNPQAVAPYVAANLITKWGANPTFRGLKSDGGYNNEGRSSWEYANIMGLNTLNYATGMPTDTNTNSNSAQPFIKIATPAQIAANPTWCFENTRVATGGAIGKARELNYTESQAIGAYTGNYYTFDFEKYVNLNIGGIDTSKKLIVTCALGFNDLNHNGESTQAKNDVLLGMEIFYNRIKAFKADAIIGFIPVVIVNESNTWSAYANLIELAIQKANTLGADIIPVWQHIDRYLAFAYDIASDLSASNNSKKGTTADVVHPTVFGAKQYANVISNYVANKL